MFTKRVKGSITLCHSTMLVLATMGKKKQKKGFPAGPCNPLKFVNLWGEKKNQDLGSF